MKENTDHTAMILTLVRRGESIPYIASVLGISRKEVEDVVERYVAKRMVS